MASILTVNQAKTLQAIAATPLAKEFYFSGGTALSHYYLQHRISEDLDFFKEDEFNIQGVTAVIKQLKSTVGFDNFDFQSSLNRNLYFLRFRDQTVLKLEFTYYPFKQVEAPKNKDGLHVDSVLDIATNKLFTIVQKPRGRDYYDLYSIIKKYSYSIQKLRKLAKAKFDWHIDPLMLASQLNKVTSFLDDPILKDKKGIEEIHNFFKQEALSLGNEIVDN